LQPERCEPGFNDAQSRAYEERTMNDRGFFAEHVTGLAWKRTLARLAAAGACAALTACASPGIVSARSNQGTFTGRVKAAADSAAVVIVAIDRSNGRIANRTFLPKAGDFAMPLDSGHYKLYAFADMDGNGARSRNEPISLLYSVTNEVRAGDRIELPEFDLGR
jgi:hypothetical protein